MNIRTRFAPSPTGCIHIGGIRTALYSWLFARKHRGKFLLRIEDTDQKRSTTESIDAIIACMRWLNIDWDEGPFFQSQRLKRYHTIIENMLIQGTAYKCYCTIERLQKLRSSQIACGKTPRYDGRCRDLHNRSSAAIDNSTFSTRFRNPRTGSVMFTDRIRGTIEFNNQELDDFIIRRSDGSPTYNFCVVIDDIDMNISHVIRGEDHISNTPRQINLIKSLGASVPEYAHVSMILNHQREKLSKRNHTTTIHEVMYYHENGFLPEALLNYLVRLGWSHGDQEIFSIEEMKQLFHLESVNKAASIFNMKKILWFNHYYINHLPPEDIANRLMYYLEKHKIDTKNGPTLSHVVSLLRSRYSTLKEIADHCQYFYQDFETFDEDLAHKYLHPVTAQYLKIAHDKLVYLTEWTPESIHSAIQHTIKILNIEISAICMPLRVAITGKSQSPALHLTMHAIGRNRTIARINMALKFIATYSQST